MVFIIVSGLLVGSFLNAVIYRLHSGESIVTKRSHCPHCNHTLGFWDLIPIISFLLLKGRCRYCQEPIFLQYPLVELATAGLFAFSYVRFFSETPLLFYYMLLVVGCMIVIFVYDLYHQIIPDETIIFWVVVTVFFHLIHIYVYQAPLFYVSVTNVIYSALFSAIAYLGILIATRGKGMGGGDVKFAFAAGLALGFPQVLVAHYIAFILGGITAVILLISGKKSFGQAVAFGPFLVLGTLGAIFWSERIISWYTSLVL